MVEISDIVDRESLRGWLEGQPQRASVVIAHRAAMLALPIYWKHVLTSRDMLESDSDFLSVLRACLLSGVGAYNPLVRATPELHEATIQASFRAPSGATLTEYSDDGKIVSRIGPPQVHPVVKSYNDSAYMSASASAASSLSEAAGFAVSSTHASLYVIDALEVSLIGFWTLIRQNCRFLFGGKDLSHAMLWFATEYPLQEKWDEIRADLAKDEVNWQFWIKWYEAALTGTPLPWELLERIALEVREEDWALGSRHVNGMIAEIELDFAVKATPNAELIIVNEDGKYASIPRSGLPSKTLGDTNERISDVVIYIRNSQKNSNQYSPLLPEADFLEGQLERYGDNALRLHEACAKVVIHVLRFVVAGSLPENDNVVGDVVSDLQNTADDIYNLDEEAKTTLDARERLRYDRLNGAQKADALRIAKAIADQSTKELGEEMVEDGAAIAGEVEPTEETKSNRYRFVSRTLKIIAIGGAGIVAITATLSQAETAVSGAKYLWKLIAPFLGL